MKSKQHLQTVLAALAMGLIFQPAWANPVPTAPSTVVTMGSVAEDIPVEMIKRMSALTNYLALSTDLNIRFRPSPRNRDTGYDIRGIIIYRL